MARTFNGTSGYVSAAITPSLPYSFACWFRTTNMTQTKPIIGFNNAAGSRYDQIWFRGAVAGDPIDILSDAGGGQVITRSTAGTSSGVYHHACAVIASATSRTIYLDGGNSATSATSVNPTVDAFNVARFPGEFFAGDIAEAALWAAALTAEEVAALANGVSPQRIRPQIIQFYAPLIRETIELRGVAITSSGTTSTDHPMVYL
ncbi:MAG: hypothetical protein KDI45_16665 [Candidatus Accumulibacter sp.]|nr:hypothetical protein [Accumulibacter sp.]